MAGPGRMGALADMLGGMGGGLGPPPEGMPMDGMEGMDAMAPAPAMGLQEILDQLEAAVASLPENQKMAAEEAASILRTALQSESESLEGDLPPAEVDPNAVGGVPVESL